MNVSRVLTGMSLSSLSELRFGREFLERFARIDVPGVQTRRNNRAALKLMRKLLKKYGFVPQNAMNAVDGATIERRIRINRPDEGRGPSCWNEKGQRATIQNRRLQHQLNAAQTQTSDEPRPPLNHAAFCLKLSDDGQLSVHVDHGRGSMRARSSSTPARPYIGPDKFSQIFTSIIPATAPSFERSSLHEPRHPTLFPHTPQKLCLSYCDVDVAGAVRSSTS